MSPGKHACLICFLYSWIGALDSTSRFQSSFVFCSDAGARHYLSYRTMYDRRTSTPDFVDEYIRRVGLLLLTARPAPQNSKTTSHVRMD